MKRRSLTRFVGTTGFAVVLAVVSAGVDVAARDRSCRWTGSLEKFKVESLSGGIFEGNKAEARLQAKLGKGANARMVTYPSSGYVKVKGGDTESIGMDIGTVTVNSRSSNYTVMVYGTEREFLDLGFSRLAAASASVALTCGMSDFTKQLSIKGSYGPSSFHYIVWVSFKKK